MLKYWNNILIVIILTMIFYLIFSWRQIQEKYFDWNIYISSPQHYPVYNIDINIDNKYHLPQWYQMGKWKEGELPEVNLFNYVDKKRKLPTSISISYSSWIEKKSYKGIVEFPYKESLEIIKKNKNNKLNGINIGMAPYGFVKIDLVFNNQTIEVIRKKMTETPNPRELPYIDKEDENYIYITKHGIPYEAWANNEKEYDIVFDFEKPNNKEVGFSYISEDGTYFQGRKTLYDTLYHQKIPVQIEQIAWSGKSGNSYCCKVPMPKNFKKYVEQKKLKEVNLRLEIENDDEHAVLYLVTNNTKEKILRFRNKIPTAEEKKNNDYAYATEVEYFMP